MEGRPLNAPTADDDGGRRPTTVAPWEPLEAPGALDLRASAARISRYTWIEARLFEVLGRWVTSTDDPAIKNHLARQSRRHGWHAELWRDRLPEVRDIVPERVPLAPGDGVEEALDRLAGLDDLADRLAGLTRVVLPHLVGACRHHLHRTSSVADGEVRHTLGLVLADLAEDRVVGDLITQTLLAAPGAPRRAAGVQADIEELIVASGGICGPATFS